MEREIERAFGLSGVRCETLTSLTNDVVLVTTDVDKFALKIYNIKSRNLTDVQWELEFVGHLARNGAPVVKAVSDAQTLSIDGTERVCVLFEWAEGEKPSASLDTYVLLGEAAAKVHRAADSFESTLPRESYGADVLLDEQFSRMRSHLTEAGQWQRANCLGDRLRQAIDDPALDRGVCHMDLTLDNIHRVGDTLTVFDFDSAGECWRSIEPYGVLRAARDRFESWLQGYRLIRHFSKADELAVSAFAVIGDIRNVAWKLGVANSSRGEPLLVSSDLPEIVDGWEELAAGI